MLRYLGVIDGQMRRMQVARISRGHDPRRIWQARAVASTVGALFVRTFERGERVHLAMVSRGYAGSMPAVRPLPAASAAGWGAALLVPAASPRSRRARRPVAAVTVPAAPTSTPEPEPAPALRLDGVAFAYPGGRQVLYGVDLEVAAGERVAVLGPNGAGKTTLMLHLNGVLRPGAGTVEVAGLPGRRGQPARGAAAGRHRVPGPRTTSCSSTCP